MSSTSLGDFEPEQQIIMVAFSLRSLLGQDGIAMVGDAGDHPRLAGAAHAFLAGMRHLDAGFAHRLKDRFARRDGQLALGARQLDDEAALLDAASNLGVKYSTWICSAGQLAVAASKAASIGPGPQQ